MEILMISYWDFQEHGMQVTMRTPLYFAEQGHHIKFLVHSEQTANPSTIVHLHPNVAVYRFNLPFKFLSGVPKINRIRQFILFAIYCIAYTHRIYKNGLKPDVIYAAECDAILIGSILRRIYKVPLVARYYGVSTILLNKRYRHLLYSLSLTRTVDMAIVTDDGTNGLEILTKFNSKIKNIKFWRNGIDPVKIDKNKISQLKGKCNLKPNDFVLLTISRLYGWKRVDRAIRMLPYLLVNNTRNVKLVVVGGGPVKSDLEFMARNLGVSDFIIFIGDVHHRDIYNFYELAYVFLSLYDMSNVGNPLLEALNSGKCIVALNTGDTSKVIRNGENGILLDVQKDEDQLAKNLSATIKILIENEAYRHNLEKNAKAYAKENLWTWDERLHAELKSIEELVK